MVPGRHSKIRSLDADNGGMKRFVLSLFVVIVAATVCIPTMAALPPGRTMINGESAPLIYTFVATNEQTLDRERSIALLQEHSDALQVLAPGGMWRIPRTPGVVVGYFSGGPSAVSERIVALSIGEGIEPLVVSVDDAISGEDGRGEAWELPTYPEPVVLDGMDDDWSSSETLIRTGAMETPPRVEESRSGTEIAIDDAAMWRVGGTGLQTVQSVLGENGWYLAFRTSETIEDGTFYHLRIFPNRDTASPAGQVVIPIAEKSGPVVFRDPGGTVSLVGQYVRRESFVECVVARDTVDSLVPDAFERRWSIDVASSRGGGPRREHFTFGTIFLDSIPRGE